MFQLISGKNRLVIIIFLYIFFNRFAIVDTRMENNGGLSKLEKFRQKSLLKFIMKSLKHWKTCVRLCVRLWCSLHAHGKLEINRYRMLVNSKNIWKNAWKRFHEAILNKSIEDVLEESIKYFFKDNVFEVIPGRFSKEILGEICEENWIWKNIAIFHRKPCQKKKFWEISEEILNFWLSAHRMSL